MKTPLLILVFLVLSLNIIAQKSTDSTLLNKYVKIIPTSARTNTIELSSDIDSTWSKWKERGYSFGFNPVLTPMYTIVNGILSTPFMVQVRGNENEINKKRWGYHLFEGYARDDKSRITLLVNKHIEFDKPVGELYYYSTVYNHSEPAYNWLRIGSDVRQHSFLFSRDKALFYGSLQLTNSLTLGNIGNDQLRSDKPEGDDEKNSEEDAKFVNFTQLKGSGDGTLFYDKDHNIVVIKIAGKWMKMVVEQLPDSIQYSF